MWQTVILGFLAGIVGGNAVPHFVRGITKEPFPVAIRGGSSPRLNPLVNFLAGWSALVLAAFLILWADVSDRPGWAIGAVSAGVLAIGLFHSYVGAFGHMPAVAEERKSSTMPA